MSLLRKITAIVWCTWLAGGYAASQVFTWQGQAAKWAELTSDSRFRMIPWVLVLAALCCYLGPSPKDEPSA